MHTSQSHQLELLGEAANMLAKAKSFDDIKGIRNKAEAVRIYAKAAKLGLELQNQAISLCHANDSFASPEIIRSRDRQSIVKFSDLNCLFDNRTFGILNSNCI